MDVVQRPRIILGTEPPLLGQRQTAAAGSAEALIRQPCSTRSAAFEPGVFLLARAADASHCYHRDQHSTSNPPPVHQHPSTRQPSRSLEPPGPSRTAITAI